LKTFKMKTGKRWSDWMKLKLKKKKKWLAVQKKNVKCRDEESVGKFSGGDAENDEMSSFFELVLGGKNIVE
jgi:hypothetical protein